MIPRLNVIQLTIALSFLFLSGCGDSQFGRVEGTVTMKGNPVSGATVTFRCDDDGTISTGTTGEDGAFQLAVAGTADKPGAKVGSHSIAVSSIEVEKVKTDAKSGSLGMMAKSKPAVKSLLPDKYADFSTSGLKFEVSKGGNVADFDLVE